MAVLPKCPSCGLESSEMRCPRCNTLKVLGCSGSCVLCKTSKTCTVPPEERDHEDGDDTEPRGA